MPKAFQTFKLAGITYLAFPLNDGFGIVDETGGWFGAWRDVDNFRAQTKTVDVASLKLADSAQLSVRTFR